MVLKRKNAGNHADRPRKMMGVTDNEMDSVSENESTGETDESVEVMKRTTKLIIQSMKKPFPPMNVKRKL